jgi:LSD1 subclass zinc finger protein
MNSATDVGSQLLCQQCAAPLPVEQGTRFVTCEFCQATNFVDKRRAVFHYAVRSTVRENDALAALRRWMGGNATVKDLDRKADIGSPQFQLFPMWMVRANQDGEEQVFLEPAAAISISELKRRAIPASDLEPYDHTLDDAATTPTVPYETMELWLAEEQGLRKDAIREVSLVHLPVYVCKYRFKGEQYTAVVDAATSEVFANLYPSKWEVPYRAIGGLAFVLYFCAAFAPLAGYLSGGGSGLLAGLGIYAVLVALLAIPIFVVALIISAKV